MFEGSGFFSFLKLMDSSNVKKYEIAKTLVNEL